MIIMLLINIVTSILNVLFSVMNPIPSIDSTIIDKIYDVFDIIFDNVNLLPIFIRVETIQQVIPLIVLISAAKHIYHMVMWIIRKIPIINIH